MPKFSVIVPNYNHASFLRERLDSILRQTYDDYEVIVLDDKSTDNSREIIESYCTDRHVSHVVYSEQNSGSPFIQWNKGFALAKGEYIWIAESDDSCDGAFLEKTVAQFDSSDVVLTFNGIRKIDGEGTCIGYHFGKSGEVWRFSGTDFIHGYMLKSNSIINASGVVFRKSVLQSIPKDYMTYRTAGDYMFWITICEQGSVVLIDEPLDYFRTHGKNTTSKAFRTGSNFFEVKRILDYLDANGHIHPKEYDSIIRLYVRWIQGLEFDSPKIKNPVSNCGIRTVITAQL